jgi:sphingomyelin phosphodiesterase acid-like 3
LRSIRKFAGWQTSCWLGLLILAGLVSCVRGEAQSLAQKVAAESVPALLVSDIHFDPFHDPARVQQLVGAPVSQWTAILRPPSSPSEQQAFAALQQSCHARGVDTPYALLRSSLQAMRSRQPDAKFITVSGDLIAHSFSCRYTTLFPGSTPAEYQGFVEKTISFIVEELRAAFPRVPVYVALGNNDTGCGDYRLDAGSDFLARTGKIIAEGLPPSDQAQAIKDFGAGGYYSVTLAAPMQATRLIVVNDLFLSTRYSTCAGVPNPAAGVSQMKWLQEQLAQARSMGQVVWVMGHIPPGIDPFSTVTKFRDVCGNEPADMFLSSDKLADLLIEYADVVRLGIFAHTHMDEVRLLEPEGGAAHGSWEHSVAIKLVPSISPVNGNKPSFTVARVNPSSAVLEDYEVIAASNQTGIATIWRKEYDYAETYHQAQLSPAAIRELVAQFKDDSRATTGASEAYIRNYFVGDLPEIKPFWPQYVCSLANHTAKGFAGCVCSAGK